MFQTDIGALIRKMRISTDTIVVNQFPERPVYFTKSELSNGAVLEIYNLPEKGVGKSRNFCLSQARADIVLFADDDLAYVKDYREKVLGTFKTNPKTDIAIFNVSGQTYGRPDATDTRRHGVHFHNFMRYGTFRIAARLCALRKANIAFSQLFGGGARFGCGEDSLFLAECLRKKLIITAFPIKIARIVYRESTWFCSYNEKYFIDKGALFAALSGNYNLPLIIRFCLLKFGQYKHETTRRRALRLMLMGRRIWLTDHSSQ